MPKICSSGFFSIYYSQTLSSLSTLAPIDLYYVFGFHSAENCLAEPLLFFSIVPCLLARQKRLLFNVFTLIKCLLSFWLIPAVGNQPTKFNFPISLFFYFKRKNRTLRHQINNLSSLKSIYLYTNSF